MKIDGECLIELIRSCRNKVQVYRSVRMPQLHTSLSIKSLFLDNQSSKRVSLGLRTGKDESES
ncbi:Metallocarboxypeptidase inhibitor, partial [Olea europaea subsp. europaea]